MSQIKIDIVVDDNGSASKLRDVETAVKDLESSGAKAAQSLNNTLKSAATPAGWGNVATQVSSIATAFSGLASAAGGLALGAAVKDAIDFTSHLEDLSAKTGTSVRDLQKLNLAGELVGVSLDQVSTAITQMQNRLVAGNPQALDAMGKLHLSVDALLDMDPGTAMNTLADAMGRLPDPADRTRVAMELFGKSGAALLPMLNGQLKAVGETMERTGLLISDAAVEGGDALDDFATIATVAFRKIVVEGLALQRLGNDMRALGSLRNFFGGDNTPTTPGAPTMFTAGNGGPLAPEKISAKEAAAIERELTAEYKRQVAERKAAAEAWQKVNDQISGKAAIASANDWMKHLKDVGGVTKLTDDATKNLTTTLNEAMVAYGKLGGVAGKASNEMLAVWAGLQKANTLAPGIVQNIQESTLAAMAMQDWAKAQVAPTIGRLGMPNDHGPQLMIPDLPGIVQEMSLATLTINQDAIQKAPLAVSPFRQAFSQLGKDLPGIIFGALQGGGSVFESIAAGFGAILARQFDSALAKVGGKFSELSLGNKALGVAGSVISGGLAVNDATSGNMSGAKRIGKGALTGAAAGMKFGPWGAAIGAGAGALYGAIKNMFGAEGRSNVKDFAASQGGFDKLHQELNKLGKEGEKLWIGLTQGVGRNNPEQAAAAIKNITDAMDAHARSPQGIAEANYKTTADMQAEAQSAVDVWQYMASSGKYSADVVQQAWDAANAALIASGDKQALAAQAANQAISELDGKINGLKASFANEAPEEVMGVIEEQARAQVKALEEQRAAAEANIDSIKDKMQPLVDGGIKIPIDFWVRTGPPGMPTGSAASDSSSAPSGDTGLLNNAGKVLLDSNGNVIGTLGGNSDNGRQYHSGGMIRRMHSGGLAGDEVPIIAQTGEFMVSRRGVAATGMRQLQRINRGEAGSGGGTSTIIVEVEGQVLTRVVVPHLIGEVQRLGLYS